VRGIIRSERVASILVDRYEVLTCLFYTKEHEWIKVENGNGAKVG